MSHLSTFTPGSDFAIDLTHVAKTYRGKVHALRGINMQVQRGAVFGLLGPNGAGKSTLVKIMMTVIRPNRCEGRILSFPVGSKATLAHIGYLPEHHKFPDYLTAAQALDFYGALSKVPRRVRRARGAELLELVGLKDWATKKVRGFSKGMRQRLGIANALMNDPDLVVLDEPTDGVDPVGRRDIRNVLLHLKSQGKTVFLNSHLLSELEMVCDHVAILVQGIVSAQGTMDELTADSRRFEIEVAPPADGAPEHTQRLLPAALSGVARFSLTSSIEAPRPSPIPPPPSQPSGPPSSTGGMTPPVPISSALVTKGELAGGVPIFIEGGSMRIGTDDPVVIQPLIDALRARGYIIRSVRPVRASLEDLFMKAVTDPVTGLVLAPGAAPNGKHTPRGGHA